MVSIQERVPILSIKCGEFRKKRPGHCFLSMAEESCPHTLSLEFTFRDEDEYVRLQCKEISAVDLRVDAKFGAIDALKGTIIVECLSPVCIDIDSVARFNQVFILKATFGVDEIVAVRHILRQLRLSYSNQHDRENLSCANSLGNKVRPFKEGLPDWVPYIPQHLYSKRTRRFIELTILTYMVFSVTWALWQLYRHVDFVREYVAPLIEMLKYQFHLLDNMVHLLNTIFEEYTTQWLCLVKPLHTVTTTMISPFVRLLEQFSPFFQIILGILTAVWQVFWPVIKPAISTGYRISKYMYSILAVVKAIVVRLWMTFFNMALPAAVRTGLQSAKTTFVVLYQDLGQTHLDPLKAQLVVVRTTIIASCKALSLAIMHLIKQIYKFIWLKRSAKAAKRD